METHSNVREAEQTSYAIEPGASATLENGMNLKV